MNSLRVTAAHEFFHAVQFGYDYGEDPWLMEATATWMEERVADDDQRQPAVPPLRPGRRARRPARHLQPAGFNQYGNWAFFEYLSSRYGNRRRPRDLEKAGELPGGGGPVLHAGGRRGAPQARRLPGGLRPLRRGQITPGRDLRRGQPAGPAPPSPVLDPRQAVEVLVRLRRLGERQPVGGEVVDAERVASSVSSGRMSSTQRLTLAWPIRSWICLSNSVSIGIGSAIAAVDADQRDRAAAAHRVDRGVERGEPVDARRRS